MTNPLFKLATGAVIDLDKIISIDPVKDKEDHFEIGIEFQMKNGEKIYSYPKKKL